jgi:limonene-1,2-epoxide hydrolase
MSDSAEVVARAFVAAINRQDVEGLAGLMTPEHRFVDSLGGVTEGREKMRAGWVGYFRMVPDFSIVVEETFCDGPVVVMLGKARGTYYHPSDEDLSPGTPVNCPDDGSLPRSPNARDLGHPELKAENRWETPAAWRALVEGGLVAEWRVYADNEPMRERMRRTG